MSAGEANAARDTDTTMSDLDMLIVRVLNATSTIAVVGMKDTPDVDAYRIPKYMADAGYKIVPVNPKLERALGETAYPDLHATCDAGVAPELVNVFRASENVEGHIDDILSMTPRPKAVWMQLGIHHGPSARRLRDAGIEVIQDRCLMVDHRRLAAHLQGRAPASR